MLNLNKYCCFPFLSFKDKILKKQGNILVLNGVIKERPKLDVTSNKRWICVFLYTAQKHPKYIQKKNNNI